MKSHFSFEIPFMRYRRQLLTISAVLLVVSLVGIATRGLTFGIEFRGGTEIDFSSTGAISIEEMRAALEATGEQDLTVQTAVTDGESGFIVRSDTTDPAVANEHAAEAAGTLGLTDDNYTVTTIGPDWGADTVRSSMTAFGVALLAILVFVSIRYEFKMSVTGVVALLHDMLIIVGVYAWTQTPITPNVIAALLTIMGYSLYDTVVEFNRVDENAKRGGDETHRTYFQIANQSINEIIVRSINTTLTNLVPITAMYFLGGTTLRDFAFAMLIGEIFGTYSSFGVASPLLAIWKTREERWAKLEARYGEEAQRAKVSKVAAGATDGPKGGKKSRKHGK